MAKVTYRYGYFSVDRPQPPMPAGRIERARWRFRLRTEDEVERFAEKITPQVIAFMATHQAPQ